MPIYTRTERINMKKIATLLVNARYILLAVFLLIAGVSFILLDKVNINNDMSKYLPSDSPMKEGTEVLKDEFPGMKDEIVLRVMFTDLPDVEKPVIKEKLSGINFVQSVEYNEADSNYNKGRYTLYILQSEKAYDTDEFKSIEQNVLKLFGNSYTVVCASNEEGADSLPTHIIIGVVIILMAILFLMSESWIEPFLFIISIGLSILINMGTNFFLPSVSKTTHSIAAILLLVLAMDYSIILSNRYREAWKNASDRGAEKLSITAMKDAIVSAIPSVCSSSLTTIVGLLALCFMNFKIGADLGIVLAKGVFISLICVFTVLPGLLILFDKLIEKTAKKVPNIPVRGLAVLEYKARIVISILFILAFAVVFYAKGSARITYGAAKGDDPVEAHFPRNNRFVVLYSNTDEEALPAMTEAISKKYGVTAVNSYCNTLGVKLSPEEMLAYIGEMFLGSSGGSSDLSGSLGDFSAFFNVDTMKLLYYDHFADHKAEKMTLEGFTAFICDDVLTDPMYSGMLKESDIESLKTLRSFCSKEAMKYEYTAPQLSKLTGVKESDLKLLMKFTGYNTLSIVELLEVLNRPEVSFTLSLTDSISDKDAAEIKFYSTFVDSIMTDKSYTAAEMAEELSRLSAHFSGNEEGSNESMKRYIGLAYLLYFSKTSGDPAWKMDIETLISHILSSETFSSFLDSDTKSMMTLVQMGLAGGKSQLIGKNYSICAISTVLIDGSDDAMNFNEYLDNLCRNNFRGNYYLIGSTPMAYEMSQSFSSEMNKITLITAIAIFIVVLITFRSVLIPAILVLLIQCSVYITMVVIGIMGTEMNYLALLIVQSLLMGATIDYAIVFTNFYLEYRRTEDKKDALISTYRASIRTILTSGLIMVFITWIMGYVFADPSVGQICHIISIGVTCALVMILCFLPAVLSVCDKLIIKRKNVHLLTKQ